MGLRSVEWYPVTWRTGGSLGSSHHGAGENSFTKRTHMVKPREATRKISQRIGQPRARGEGLLRPVTRNLGRRNRPGNLSEAILRELSSASGHDAAVWILPGGNGEIVPQILVTQD